MREKIKKNGLELTEINSQTQSLGEVKDIDEAFSKFFSEDGFVVAYLTNKILIGKYESHKLHFYKEQNLDPQFLLSLRLFNTNKELFIWRTQGTLKGRLRTDGIGEETFIVDACQLLWGTDSELYGDGFTRLFEERGTEIIFPLSDLRVNAEKKRVFIKTRNYVEFNPETSLASYGDCRFVEFLNFE